MPKGTEAQPSTYEPSKKTIGQILATTSPPIIVPDWQRNYSWSTSHVETFWNDLLDFEKRHFDKGRLQYFLGSFVIVETTAGHHLLLDGQQRLATSAILLSVIRDHLKDYKEDAAHRLQARYLADVDDAKNETVYKLTLNAYDREYFRRKILEFRSGSYTDPEADHASHKLIADARDYFTQEFQAYYEQHAPDKAYHWALKIQDVLMNHVTVIAVTSIDEDSAAEVFETLNDRGIGLSTPDLLRNLVIRRAPESVREDIVELWGEVIEFDTDSAIRSFLRHYWISNHGDIKSQRLYREIKSHIVDNSIESLPFSRSLRDASSLYRDIVSARHDDPQIESLLKDISMLGAGANILLPVILSILQCVSEKYQAKLLEALLNLYVRHSVIGQLENSKLENVIYKVATALRHKAKAEQAISELAAFSPSDDATISSFQRLSLTQNGVRRYVLTKLEMARRTTEELNVNPPPNVHVEHIYPQTPKAGQRLPNHPQVINRVGNLTLLSRRLNTSVRNETFDKKLPFYEKSEIHLTNELCQYDKWGLQDIERRQAKLGATINNIWPTVQPDEVDKAK